VLVNKVMRGLSLVHDTQHVLLSSSTCDIVHRVAAEEGGSRCQ
jgi:hypothetical protein